MSSGTSTSSREFMCSQHLLFALVARVNYSHFFVEAMDPLSFLAWILLLPSVCYDVAAGVDLAFRGVLGGG